MTVKTVDFSLHLIFVLDSRTVSFAKSRPSSLTYQIEYCRKLSQSRQSLHTTLHCIQWPTKGYSKTRTFSLLLCSSSFSYETCLIILKYVVNNWSYSFNDDFSHDFDIVAMSVISHQLPKFDTCSPDCLN